MTDKNKLHPNIGGRIFINPGTGPVEGASETNAMINIFAFVDDSPIDNLTIRRTREDDYGDGRYSFKVGSQGQEVDIQMPGWELERVRFMGDDQNPWDYPRLYLEHGSCLWIYALLVPEYFVDLGADDG